MEPTEAIEATKPEAIASASVEPVPESKVEPVVSVKPVKLPTDLLPDLMKLGQSSKAVADGLRDLHMKGQLRRSYCCPISNYLIKLGYQSPVVGSLGIIIGEKGSATTAHTPSFIESFLSDFDGGAYPDLVDDSVHDMSV